MVIGTKFMRLHVAIFSVVNEPRVSNTCTEYNNPVNTFLAEPT